MAANTPPPLVRIGQPPNLVATPGRLLAAVLERPGATLRELAERCGRTERAVWEWLGQLERSGLLRRERRGRRSRYVVDTTVVSRQIEREAGLLVDLAAQVRHTNGHSQQPTPYRQRSASAHQQ